MLLMLVFILGLTSQQTEFAILTPSLISVLGIWKGCLSPHWPRYV